jgi:argonaute-like protein implicated in RNA metabolism and viral defense
MNFRAFFVRLFTAGRCRAEFNPVKRGESSRFTVQSREAKRPGPSSGLLLLFREPRLDPFPRRARKRTWISV